MRSRSFPLAIPVSAFAGLLMKSMLLHACQDLYETKTEPVTQFKKYQVYLEEDEKSSE